MEIDQLRYFCAVAESNSVTAAARLVHVSQSALSQQILKLEAELGAQLFVRVGGLMNLSRTGKALLPLAKSIVNQVRQASNVMQTVSNLESGAIILGASPTVAPYILPNIIGDFRRKYPSVRVKIVEAFPRELLSLLRVAEIDIAVTQLQVKSPDFATQELLRDPFEAVIPAGHRLAKSKTIDLKDLAREPFIALTEGHAFEGGVLGALQEARVHPAIVFEALSISSAIAMVCAGLGVSMLPKIAVEQKRGCKFIPLTDEWPYRVLGFVRMKKKPLSPIQRIFLNVLSDAYAGWAKRSRRVAS